MKKTFKLVIGDNSGDGHEKSEDIYVSANADLSAAYNKGTELLGFDFCKTCCEKYHDSYVSHEKIKKLVELGLPDWTLAEDGDPELTYGYQLDASSFADIYLFICKLGNPSLELTVTSDDVPEIHVGGYGLFY